MPLSFAELQALTQTGTIAIMHSDITTQLNFFTVTRGYFYLPAVSIEKPSNLNEKMPEDGDFYLPLFYCKNIWIKKDLGLRPGRCSVLFLKVHNVTIA